MSILFCERFSGTFISPANFTVFVFMYVMQCGVPKKGHVCPYQPKLKRRPDEPPPEMKNASTQVEMDEFLVLRRLNLEIQGFPESYVSEPGAMADLCGAEPHHPPPPMAVGMPPYSAAPPAAEAAAAAHHGPGVSMAVGPDDPMPPAMGDDAAGGGGATASTPSSDKKKKAKKK
jgi:hypothetical protein